MFLNLMKILIPTAVAFFFGLLVTPFATHFFYKYRMWKKRTRTTSVSSTEFSKIHKAKEASEVSTPCVGGIIVWVSVLLTTLLFYGLSFLFKDYSFFVDLNFLSRGQTFVPLAVFVLGALLGLLDDVLEINGFSNITRDSKWYTKLKLGLIVFIGLIAGFWFFAKLGMESIDIPWGGVFYLGVWFVPFVILIMLASFSTGVIDGIDGLSGGVLASIFAAYAVIAYTDNQIDLAAFSAVISGATLAFLWFNIPPARFYMGETGMMPLTIVLATIAFLTDTVLLLPIIAFPLVMTSFSSSVQLIAKRFGRKVFKVAPLHHHFEALGWPSYKVTMRYWVISVIFAVLGILLTIISR
ncbi:MAG: hypothetical protein ACKOW9_04945 [Candidatus Paceibacterota bacterium]